MAIDEVEGWHQEHRDQDEGFFPRLCSPTPIVAGCMSGRGLSDLL